MKDEIKRLIKLGQLNPAWKMLQQYIANNRQDPEGIILVSVIQEKAGMIDKAIATLQHARTTEVQLKAFTGDLAAQLIRLFAKLQDKERVEKHCENLTTPTLPASFNAIGLALASVGLYQQSKNYFLQGLETFPNDVALLEGLANIHMFLGEFEAAEQALTKAILLAPDNGKLVWMLADLARQFAPEKVERLLEEQLTQAKRNAKLDDSAFWHYGIGHMATRVEQYERAGQHYIRGAALKKKEFLDYKVDDEINWLKSVNKAQVNLPTLTLNEASDEEAMPIFVIGMPRSGTTLISTKLASHSDIKDLGELPYIPMLADAQVQGKISIKELRQGYFKRINADISGFSYFIDQLPTNFIHVNLIRAAFPEATIIEVERDLNDVLVSNFCFLFGPQNMPFSYDLDDLTQFLGFYRSLKLTPDISVSYEQFVSKPNDTLAGIFKSLRLEMTQTSSNVSAVATGSLVQVRQKVYTSSVNKWQKFTTVFEPHLPIKLP